MANPWHHAVSSVRKWGGRPSDYLPVHQWFDASKEMHGDFRHRALRHHAQGIFEAERVFGTTITVLMDGGREREIPVRWIGEQHVTEDLGRIPSLSDWLRCIEPHAWMNRSRPLSRELERDVNDLTVSSPEPLAESVRIGALLLHPAKHAVEVDGEERTLTTREYELLLALAAAPTRVFTKQELLRDVWGFRSLGRTRTLDSHASRLRRKLDPKQTRFVVNVWGVGYRLVDA